MKKKSFAFKIEEIEDLSEYYFQDKKRVKILDKISQIMFFILLFFSLPLAMISREVVILTGICDLILLFLYISTFNIPYKAKTYLNGKEEKEVADKLVRFFDSEKIKDMDSEIEEILSRIEKTKQNFVILQKVDKLFHIISTFSTIAFIVNIIFMVLFSVLEYDIFTFKLWLLFFIGIFVFLTCIVFYKLVERNFIFYKNFKELFSISFYKKLNENIQSIIDLVNIKVDKLNLDIEDLSLKLNVWFEFYLGIYYENFELNKLLKEFRTWYFDLDNVSLYYNLFFTLKTKIQDYILRNTNMKVSKPKLDNIFKIINNYLEKLKFNIDNKVVEKKERRDKMQILRIYVYIISFIFSIFISFLSIYISIIK